MVPHDTPESIVTNKENIMKQSSVPVYDWKFFFTHTEPSSNSRYMMAYVTKDPKYTAMQAFTSNDQWNFRATSGYTDIKEAINRAKQSGQRNEFFKLPGKYFDNLFSLILHSAANKYSVFSLI